MIHTLIRFLRGYVRIRVEGYSPERFLNMCSYHSLYIWGLAPSGQGYEFCMSARDLKKIRPLARKTHTKIRVTGRYGLPFLAVKYRKRKLFFFGILVCVILLKVYSLFIWDIHFEGNERRTDEALSAYLESTGVRPLMLKSSVDCPGIVKNIRKEYNDIVWVSASLDGSRLKIQVKENEDPSLGEDADVLKDEPPVDLVASADGVITEIVTRSGVPQVHVGDEVKKGDILVLGRVDVLNDAGEVTGYQYRHSDADIYADTQMEYTDTISLIYEEKNYENKMRYRPFLRIGSVTLSVGTLNNDFERCEITSSETALKLGENFRPPVSFGIQTARAYTLAEKRYEQEEAREILSVNFSRFCGELEEKGVQIRDNSVKIHLYDDSAEASGTVYLTESIAQEADTEILTIERKETDESVGTDD